MQEPSFETRTGAAELTGTVAGRFVILKMLGAGGMGQVYQAQDTKLRRVVAIKRMAPHLQQDEGDRRKFLREAQQASALNHPNVAGIYDVIEEGGEILLIMEYVEGTPLRLVMHKGFSDDEFFELAIQALEGLNAAHDKGIVHCDIKPENIMLTPEGRLKILDFGVARRFSLGNNEATLTVETLTSSVSGTPAYMAPEVLMQKRYDGRADLFSMGLVYYEMLGGQQPFETDSIAGTMASVLHKEPSSLDELNPKVSAGVCAVVRTMLEKNPARRYSSARDVLIDLRRVQQGENPVFTQGVTPESKKSQKQAKVKLSKKMRIAIAVAAAVVLVLVAAEVWGPRLLRRLATSEAGSAAQSSTLVPERKSIAVLPFAAVASDPKMTAFGKGLLENVAAKLSQLGANHDLEVVPARTLEDKKIATLADAKKEFGVNLSLTVSLEQANDLFRASYSLTDARSGKNLAGAQITVPVSDLFTIEDQVANGVASALQISLRRDEKQAFGAHSTSQPEAYQYFVQGLGYLQDSRKPEKLTSAEIVFKQALKIDPNFGQAEAGLGQTYWLKYQLGKQKQWITPAQQACTKAVDLGNAGAEGHMCLGLLENGTGHYEKAAEQFQQAVQLEPVNERAYASLAEAYQHLNLPDKAEETYKRAITARPQYWRGYNRLGAFYVAQAEYDKAGAMYRRATELDPDNYLAWNNLGSALLYAGNDDEATQAFEKSIVMRPSSDAYNNLAVAEFRLHRFKNSVLNFKEALKFDDNNYQTWGNLGDASYYGGDPASAMESYRKAIALAEPQLKVNPRDATVLGDLASYYSMLGERKQALSYLDRSLQLGPGNKDLLLNAAVVYNQLRETGVALEWLRKALAAGYSRSVVATGAPFDNLHDNPRYQALMQQK